VLTVSASKRVVVTMEKAEEKEERENDETLIVFPCLPPIKHSPPDKYAGILPQLAIV